MKNWISALLVGLLGASLAGCGSMDRPNPDSSKEYIGMFSGAIVGGLAGSALGQKGGGRLTDISIGAVVGALLGCGIGMFLDDQDRAKALAEKNQDPNAVNDKPQRVSNWQHASNPMVSQVETAAKATPGKNPVAEKKGLAASKTVVDKKIADKKEPDKKDAGKKEAAASAASVNDKILSLWRNLPSTQWFVNDVKQEDVG